MNPLLHCSPAPVARADVQRWTYPPPTPSPSSTTTVCETFLAASRRTFKSEGTQLPTPYTITWHNGLVEQYKNQIKWMQTNVRQKVWGTGGNQPRWDKPRGHCYRAGYCGRLSGPSFFTAAHVAPRQIQPWAAAYIACMTNRHWLLPSNLTHISPDATTQDNTLITFVQCWLIVFHT